MTRVCAPEVSRSTADWASSGSVIMASHSAGSRLEVTMVAALWCRSTTSLVEVGGLGGVQRPEGEVVEDEHVDAGEAADLGVEGVVQPGGPEPGEQLVGAGMRARDRRRRIAMCPSAVARWVLPTPTGPEDQDAVAGLEEPQAWSGRQSRVRS